MESVLSSALPSVRSRRALSQSCCSTASGHIVLYCRDAPWRKFCPRGRQCAASVKFPKSIRVGSFKRRPSSIKANVTNSRNVAADPQPSGLRPGPEKLPPAEVVVAPSAGEAALEEGVESGEISDELWKLLVLVPEHIGQKLVAHPEIHNLVEIVLDLGRRPLARFLSGDWYISETKVTVQDLQHAISMVLLSLLSFLWRNLGGDTTNSVMFDWISNRVWEERHELGIA